MASEPTSPDAIPLVVRDLRQFARALRARWPETPSHQAVLNAVARAAGFRNYQHLRASQPGRAQAAPPDLGQVRKAAAWFDDATKLTGIPAKRSLRVLCLWGLWSQLPRGHIGSERDLSRRLDDLCRFRDAASLRREMVGEGLLSRSKDGQAYRRQETPPDPTARALIRALHAQGEPLDAPPAPRPGPRSVSRKT